MAQISASVLASCFHHLLPTWLGNATQSFFSQVYVNRKKGSMLRSVSTVKYSTVHSFKRHLIGCKSGCYSSNESNRFAKEVCDYGINSQNN